jgi:hypothetical protein
MVLQFKKEKTLKIEHRYIVWENQRNLTKVETNLYQIRLVI